MRWVKHTIFMARKAGGKCIGGVILIRNRLGFISLRYAYHCSALFDKLTGLIPIAVIYVHSEIDDEHCGTYIYNYFSNFIYNPTFLMKKYFKYIFSIFTALFLHFFMVFILLVTYMEKLGATTSNFLRKIMKYVFHYFLNLLSIFWHSIFHFCSKLKKKCFYFSQYCYWTKTYI